MKYCITLLICLLIVTVTQAQVYTGYTQVGADGGGSVHAECTEILAFDNYDDNIAGSNGGQNFVFALLNGDSLYLNVQRTGNATYTLTPPSTVNSSFGQFGYTGLTGLSDFYVYSYGNALITFSNIVLKDHSGNVVPNYTMTAFDGEATGYAEQIVFSAPTGYNWYDWDSMAPSAAFCSPTRSGEGTNTAYITGQCFLNLYDAFGFAVDAPGSFSVAINGGGSGKEGVVIGIKRIIVAPNDTICGTGAVNININPVNASTGTTYTWPAPVISPPGSITGGTAQASAITAIAQTLTNTTNSIATATYTFSPVSCGLPGNPFTSTVVILPVSGTGSVQNICSSTATITAAGTGSWVAAASNPVTTNITNPGNYITTVTGLTATGTYQFIWTNAGGCTDTARVIVSNTVTAPQLSASQTTICPNDSAQICAPAGYATYSWNTGSSARCINTAAQGSYEVTVSNGNGCSAVSNPISIAVSAGSAGPNQLICGNTTTMAATGTGSWSALPSNPITAGITNTSSPNTSISGLTVAGNYQFIWTTTGGCTDTVKIAVADTAVPPQLNATQTTICPGDSTQICAPAGYAGYYWNTGDTTDCIVTPYAGKYYVMVTENGGCSAVSGQLNIVVRQPAPVTVSITGDTLFVYSAVSYQWYLDGNPIPGATSQTYIATTGGDYMVQILDANGCHDNSSPVFITGIEDIANNHIALYPNPGTGTWQLQVNSGLIGSEMQIFDIGGQIVYQSPIRAALTTISPQLAQGVYLLRINSATGVLTVKLLKL